MTSSTPPLTMTPEQWTELDKHARQYGHNVPTGELARAMNEAQAQASALADARAQVEQVTAELDLYHGRYLGASDAATGQPKRQLEKGRWKAQIEYDIAYELVMRGPVACEMDRRITGLTARAQTLEVSLASQAEQIAQLTKEKARALSVLATNSGDDLEDACRQVKQVAISEADNSILAMGRIAALEAERDEAVSALASLWLREPMANGEYPHILTCNAARKEPIGCEGCSCPIRYREAADPRSPWLPIESAPKDGTPVLVLESGALRGMAIPHITQAQWKQSQHYKAGGAWEQISHYAVMVPTHWMPLLDPPSSPGDAPAQE
jgi:hypothetical protein